MWGHDEDSDDSEKESSEDGEPRRAETLQTIAKSLPQIQDPVTAATLASERQDPVTVATRASTQLTLNALRVTRAAMDRALS